MRHTVTAWAHTIAATSMLIGIGLCLTQNAIATEPAATQAQAPVTAVTELRFREFYRMPIGPKGLEASDKLRALDGKPVRMVGYMVQQEVPLANRFIFTHLPVSMSEDEDGLADDLPPNVVYVHLQHSSELPLKHLSGLLQLTGTLSLGEKEEADGRVSSVRLMLDRQASDVLVTASGQSANEHAHIHTKTTQHRH